MSACLVPKIDNSVKFNIYMRTKSENARRSALLLRACLDTWGSDGIDKHIYNTLLSKSDYMSLNPLQSPCIQTSFKGVARMVALSITASSLTRGLCLAATRIGHKPHMTTRWVMAGPFTVTLQQI